MSFEVEHIVKFKISYGDCYGNAKKGEVTFDFDKKSFKFSEAGGNSRGTFKISDMRELVSIYDEEEKKVKESKTPEQLAEEAAKKAARAALRRENAAKKKAALVRSRR